MKQVFFEIHSDNPREGPGNFESTKKAFESLIDLPLEPKILDIGCGPGEQTFDLLEISDAQITAVDYYQQYLDSIKKKLNSTHFKNRLKIFKQDMNHLDFEDECFDVIWSEGAIYIMGFENGLNVWKKFLKPGGYIAVTEITWIKDNSPQDLCSYWIEAYPGIQSIDNNLKTIEKCGYKPVNHFILPKEAWWEYYNPIIKKLPALKEKYKNDQEASAVIAEEENEIELYKKYSNYYGYVFYIMQKQLNIPPAPSAP